MLRTFLSILSRWLRPHPTPPPPPKPTPPVPNPTPAPVGLDVAETIRLINLERTSRRLVTLVNLALLDDSAQAWADTMARNDNLTHGNFQGRMSAVLPNTAAGEDIGEAFSPAQIVAMWMASLPHRENILGPWNVIGVGLARSRTGTPYWCADFDQTLR